MRWKPEDKEGRPSTHRGVYDFRIIDAQAVKFRTGTEGTKLVLEVFLPGDRLIKVFENLFNTPKALWKVEQACQAVGLDFATRPKPEEYIGQTGKAFFDRRKDSKFLEVSEFVARDKVAEYKPKDPTPAEPKTVLRPQPQAADDDFPF